MSHVVDLGSQEDHPGPWYRTFDAGRPHPGDLAVTRGGRLGQVTIAGRVWWSIQGTPFATLVRRPTEAEVTTWALAHLGAP